MMDNAKASFDDAEDFLCRFCKYLAKIKKGEKVVLGPDGCFPPNDIRNCILALMSECDKNKTLICNLLSVAKRFARLDHEDAEKDNT